MTLPEPDEIHDEARRLFPTNEDQQAVYRAGMFEAMYKLALWQLTAVLDSAERVRRGLNDRDGEVDYGTLPTLADLVTRRERPLLAEPVA